MKPMLNSRRGEESRAALSNTVIAIKTEGGMDEEGEKEKRMEGGR